MTTFRSYQHKQPKHLEPSGIVYSYDNTNLYGRVVGSHEVTIESQIRSKRHSVLSTLHTIRVYREMGHDKRAEDYYFQLRNSLKNYRKYWRRYLKAMEGKL